MRASPRRLRAALTVRWIARIAGALLAFFNVVYMVFATLMIAAAGEELFPKMALSFLALNSLSIALLVSWRWETLGAVAVVAGLLAYRAAERTRLGYEPESHFYTVAILATAALFLVSSLLHLWLRRQPPAETPPVEPA